MKPLKILLLLFIVFYSCKKNNTSKTSTRPLLVKTITSKIRKVDSSGRYYTAVDSFQYDNQNRVIKYVSLGYDTSILYDARGNIISMTPTLTTSLTTVNYAGNNSIPSGYSINGQVAFVTSNPSGQIITDSISPPNVTHYFYSTGLVVGQFGNTNSYYSLDSTLIDANNNVTTVTVGGNYFLDSLNNPKFGRVAAWKFSYGGIPNPVFANPSTSVMLFLFTNFFNSKYIKESTEYTTYAQNMVIASDQVSNFKNTVDANNVIQRSANIANDEFVAWTYY